MQSIQQSRRNFLKTSSMAAIAGSVILLTFKSSKSFAASNQIQATISANHGHSFSIALTDLQSNGPTNYSIQGSSGHDHKIQVTADVIQALQQGHPVELESTGSSHTHTVMLELV
jgi:hypothetical protein